MTEPEVPLTGGRVTKGVVLVGDVVHRPVKPTATDLAALLGHLHRGGFVGAPRFLGIDEHGRARLTYIAGEVPADLGHFSDEQLAAAATLLRRFHDVTTTFPAVLAAGAEVVCHNDFGPPNTVFHDGLPEAMIDFDTAAPGMRLWDLGYSAFAWLDLGDAVYSATEQVRRLKLFTAAYDHPQCSAAKVAVYAVARQVGLASRADRIGDAAMNEWASQAASWTAANVLDALCPSGLPPYSGS